MRRRSLHAPPTPAAAGYARAAFPRGRTPWRLADYLVVDLELSGLDARSDEIVSFGAVPIDAGRVITADALYGLCRPTSPLPERSILVHGIRTADLVDAAPLDEAIQPLIAAMAGRVLVVHVEWVERSFLAPVMKRLGLRLHEPVLDTYQLGRLLALERDLDPGDLSLEGLARSLGLPVHRQHHALSDALTTAQVFLALATHLESFTPETVDSLSRAKERSRLYAH